MIDCTLLDCESQFKLIFRFIPKYLYDVILYNSLCSLYLGIFKKYLKSSEKCQPNWIFSGGVQTYGILFSFLCGNKN